MNGLERLLDWRIGELGGRNPRWMSIRWPRIDWRSRCGWLEGYFLDARRILSHDGTFSLKVSVVQDSASSSSATSSFACSFSLFEPGLHSQCYFLYHSPSAGCVQPFDSTPTSTQSENNPNKGLAFGAATSATDWFRIISSLLTFDCHLGLENMIRFVLRLV